MKAPIALFAYNRPIHLGKTLQALKDNIGASESELFIFSDAAKDPTNPAQLSLVNEVRDLVKNVSGFKKVTVVERETNLGLAASIISGVTDIVGRFGNIIVVEDDLVSSPHFLTFMNEALELYKSDEDVASIHGYVYPVRGELPETFFIRGADCWGWATWARAWKWFEPDGRKLMALIEAKNLKRQFNLGEAYDYWGMLVDQVEGRNNSWAVRWHASAFVRGSLTLWPGKTLVQNIGFDASGIHCEPSSAYDVDLGRAVLDLKKIEIKENQAAVHAFSDFFRRQRPTLLQRALKKFRLGN